MAGGGGVETTPARKTNHMDAGKQMTEPDKDKRWIKVKDVAEMLEVTPQRVSQMVRDDLIPHYRIGRTVKVDRKEFERWLLGRRRGPSV